MILKEQQILSFFGFILGLKPSNSSHLCAPWANIYFWLECCICCIQNSDSYYWGTKCMSLKAYNFARSNFVTRCFPRVTLWWIIFRCPFSQGNIVTNDQVHLQRLNQTDHCISVLEWFSYQSLTVLSLCQRLHLMVKKYLQDFPSCLEESSQLPSV